MDCTNPLEYSMYTAQDLYIPSKIPCLHRERIARILWNTQCTLRAGYTRPLVYAVYGANGAVQAL